MMNIGHMFVQAADVENEANYQMNGKQLVATPTHEDISMSLSFFQSRLIPVSILRRTGRCLEEFNQIFVCDTFHEDNFSLQLCQSFPYQIIY